MATSAAKKVRLLKLQQDEVAGSINGARARVPYKVLTCRRCRVMLSGARGHCGRSEQASRAGRREAQQEQLVGQWQREQLRKRECVHGAEKEDSVTSWIKGNPGWVTSFPPGNNPMRSGLARENWEGRERGWVWCGTWWGDAVAFPITLLFTLQRKSIPNSPAP